MCSMNFILVLMYAVVQQSTNSYASDVRICEEHTATADFQQIYYPNFPNNYSNNVYCITKLSSPENTFIELAFAFFELEDSVGCDSLHISDSVSATLLQKSCGETFFWPHYPDKILSTTNDMTITFEMNYKITYRRFNASFRAVRPSTHIMIMAENSAIRIVNRYSNVNNAAIPNKISDPLAVDYDPRSQYVFYSDRGTRTIGKFHVKRHSVEDILHSDLILEPHGLRIDVNSRLLYWTDAELGTISVSNLDGEYRNTLVDTQLDKPGAIVTEPYKGYIYFTDYGNDAKIERADGDGTNRLILVNSLIVSPRSLAIDLKERVLYWIDGSQNSLESVNCDGSGRTMMKSVSQLDISSLVLDAEAFFWSGIHPEKDSEGYIRFIDRTFKTDGYYVKWGSNKHYKGLSLRPFQESGDIIPDTCPTANCSGLCLPKPNKQYNCLTEDETPPVISSCPNDIYVNITSPGQTEKIVTWIEPNLSGREGEAKWLLKPSSSGTAFQIGSTQITYMASDQFCNHAQCSFFVIVSDYVVPTTIDKDMHTLNVITGLIMFGLLAVTLISCAAICSRSRQHGSHNRNEAVDSADVNNTYFTNDNITNSAHMISATNSCTASVLSVSGGSADYAEPETEPYYSGYIKVY